MNVDQNIVLIFIQIFIIYVYIGTYDNIYWATDFSDFATSLPMCVNVCVCIFLKSISLKE